MRHLAVDQALGHDADHLAARGQRGVGQRPHAADARPAIDDGLTRQGQTAAKIARGLQKDLVSASLGAQKHAHPRSTSHCPTCTDQLHRPPAPTAFTNRPGQPQSYISLNSMRRFLARPLASLLSASGLSGPKPKVVMRSAKMPFSTK